MKRHSLIALLALLSASAVFGQSMMSGSGSSGGTGSMMSANSDSSGNSMLATADPKVGNELRYAKSTGKKVIFTTLAAARALAAKGPTVLFFAADWCPYCQADLKDINANGSRLKDITIVVLDYDKEKDLAKTYAVTVQDTFVQIDAKGAKLGIWNGGGIDRILQRIARG